MVVEYYVTVDEYGSYGGPSDIQSRIKENPEKYKDVITIQEDSTLALGKGGTIKVYDCTLYVKEANTCEVKILTKDGIEIGGYYQKQENSAAVVLSPNSKDSYDAVKKQLREYKDFEGITYDNDNNCFNLYLEDNVKFSLCSGYFVFKESEIVVLSPGIHVVFKLADPIWHVYSSRSLVVTNASHALITYHNGDENSAKNIIRTYRDEGFIYKITCNENTTGLYYNGKRVNKGQFLARMRNSIDIVKPEHLPHYIKTIFFEEGF